MAYKYDPTIEVNIKRLIVKLAKFEENSDVFNYIYEYFTRTLLQADSTLCVTRTEIDAKIASLSDKFIFHGFPHEASTVARLYHRYIHGCIDDEELRNRLTVIKFLFALSTCPTAYLASLPCDIPSNVDKVKNDDIDWGAYLKEGIERWNPNFDESDEFSDIDDEEETATERTQRTLLTAPSSTSTLVLENGGDGGTSTIYLAETIIESEPAIALSVGKTPSEYYQECKEILYQNVQNGWFVDETVRNLPHSDHPEANIAIRWEEYMSEVSHGLLGGPHTKIITEYKALREVLWQFHAPHSSVIFAWSGNRLIVNENVTIASMRPFVFKNLMESFLPDISALHTLRTFHAQVIEDANSPHTYRGYAESLTTIVRPAIAQLIAIEQELIRQQDTMTLIKLGNRLRAHFKDVKYVAHVHRAVARDYRQSPVDYCSMHLLAALYRQLSLVFDKRQMDICLTLYIDSIYKYVRIIEEWYRSDELNDSQREFPIRLQSDDFEQCHSNKEAFERANYIMTVEEFADDPLMALLQREILQSGRQIRLLTLLGKLHLLHEANFSVYDEFKASVAAILAEYSAIDRRGQNGVAAPSAPDDLAVISPAMCKDYCKYTTDLDLIENILDVTDGFLMAAFSSSLLANSSTAPTARDKKETTFEEISALTQNNFPGVQKLLADNMARILSATSRKCSNILKTIFKQDHDLLEHFDLMAKVFLFKDDLIFPFYRRVFEKIETNSNWGNDIWLTFDLQDVFMDMHPKYYEQVVVTVKEGWQFLLEDPLKTCTLINVTYKLVWPVDIIITEQNVKMYRELFYFILKIKWALYTLNHMQGKRKRDKMAPRSVAILLQRLDLLRFGFINIFAALQHYILGYVFGNCREKFAEEFEGAKDLDSLIRSHSEFIYSFHRQVARVRDYEAQAYGFDRALYLVRRLRMMWLAPEGVHNKHLKKSEAGLRICHKNIFEVISCQPLD